jgi:hypothetical protein
MQTAPADAAADEREMTNADKQAHPDEKEAKQGLSESYRY